MEQTPRGSRVSLCQSLHISKSLLMVGKLHGIVSIV